MSELQVDAPQHMLALAAANQIRLGRAGLKRRIRASRDSKASAAELATILTEGVPPALAGMTMDALLRCVFQSPPSRRRRWTAEAETSPTRLLGALSARQVELLVAALCMSGKELADREEIRVFQRSRRAA